MKTRFERVLFVLIILLVVSCNRSKNEENVKDVSDIAVSETVPVIETIEEPEEILSITDYIVNVFSERIPGMSEKDAYDYSDSGAAFLDSADHLIEFTGEYFFETFVNIEINDQYINEGRFKYKALNITLDQDNNCLLLTCDLFDVLGVSLDSYSFIETADEKPFFWLFTDNAGYSEIILYFYEDGIILLHDSVAGSDGGYDVDIKKYGVYFKKTR